MPLRVNYSGVMPIIFAQAILMFPQKLFLFAGQTFSGSHNQGAKLIADLCGKIARALSEGAFWYLFLYSMMILFFSYFWVATQFNELQIADDLKKNGGYISGGRPGVGDREKLHKCMSRITLAGETFLSDIAPIPLLFSPL